MTRTERDTRFVRVLLRRHGGDARAALLEARALGAMSEYGRPWWAYIASRVAFLRVCQIAGEGR